MNSQIRTWLPAIIGILTLFILPGILDGYLIYLIGTVGIYTIVTLSLNILIGDTGQFSVGHAAFFAIGAYTASILMIRLSVPFLISMTGAAFLSGLIGLLVGLPATRLRGPYLAIATMAFGVLAQHILREWESMTGGRDGLIVPTISVGPFELGTDRSKYYLIWVITLMVWWIIRNLERSRIGFAWRGLRDTEIAAQAVGIKVFWYKALAFGVSAFFTGVAGALFAPHISYISYESFGLLLAILFASAVILGGVGSTIGSLLGAAYLTLAPELFRGLEEVQMVAYGLVMVLVIIFMPRGMIEIPSFLRLLFRRVLARWVKK